MLIPMPSCGGCRTCEMACSFRHRQVFIPSVSSIAIVERGGAAGFLVSLTGKDRGGRIACDGCRDRDAPECVLNCQKADDLEEIIRNFIAAGKK